MGELYTVCGTEKVQQLENELTRELTELRNEIEENEMVHGIQRAVGSVPLPKGVDHFRQERKVVLDRILQVSSARPLCVQADAMRTEMDNALKSDYTIQGLPLLLHQFFCDRIHQLVQCKHMHMLRWKRFCEHTSTIESLFPEYQKRLAHIMQEYNDALQRAQRLSAARESLLAANDKAALSVKMDDLLIYLRWLICHFHSVKKFNQYLKVLQWMPVSHKKVITPSAREVKEDDGAATTRIPSKYQDDFHISPGRSSRPTSATSVTSLSAGMTPPPAPPPPVNPVSLAASSLSTSQFTMAAAAAGGGIASDERSQGLPLTYNDLDHLKSHLNFLVNLYNIPVDVQTMSSSADEMELYAAVNRRFRQLFSRQEHMKTFKTYDRLEVGQENWGADSSIHALLQDSNWMPYITLKAERDLNIEQKMVELRTRKNVDPLLQAQSKFIHITDPEKVQDALREHAAAVREPYPTQAVSVTSNRTQYHTGAIWKRIYTSPELYKKEEGNETALEEFDEKDADKFNFNGRAPRAQSSRKRKDSYDYIGTVQLLGLDEGEQDNTDSASIQGAFQSFLQLRHLRIRDLQRTCLSLLNYFRSIQRTLTINDGGLSQESDHVRRTSPQNHRKSVVDGSIGAGGGLGSHQYMHNTPADFRISETDFMEFSEVENHDDFYTVEEGRVHVQDQRGYYIIYDKAEQDLRDLEKDLLLIGTHYIERDRDLRTASGIFRSESAKRKRDTSTSAGDFDIPSYAHQEIDRFAVLLDLWTNEAAYLECKREVLDCYLEAYQHVFDRDEKRLLAQVITNVMFKRPRLDFAAPYFIKSYRLECVNLRQHADLVKTILDNQIEEEREYVTKVAKDGDKMFGLPYQLIAKQPVSINMSKSALRNVYMLEFHPSLAVASRLPAALKHAYWELHHAHKPETVTEMLLLEKKLLETALSEWSKMEKMGTSFSSQIQKDLFSDIYADDPAIMSDLATYMAFQEEQQSSKKTQKQKQEAVIGVAARLFQVLAARYDLMYAAWETEILSKIYKKQAVALGYDECHLFLRFVQFEFANFKNDAGKPPPVFITEILEDDSNMDRFSPSNLYLAIHELDEGHVGRFTFRNRDGLLHLLRPGGVESFHVVLKCQVVHKNALISAVQQVNACQPVKETDVQIVGRPSSPTETKSEKSSQTAMTGVSTVTPAPSMASKLQGSSKSQMASEAFVSLQLEKTPSRDLMLNEFVTKKSSMGTILRNPDEMEKLKRRLLTEYCMALNMRLTQYSIRGQLLAYYNSILGLLQDFPSVRDTYFRRMQPSEKKTEMDDVEGLQLDARTLHERPRRLLSSDGKKVLNIWFIPDYHEILIMFKTLEDKQCTQALSHCVHIVAALHDIVQYLCAHARLGSSQVRLGSRKMEFVSADWGGAEGIGADLRDIQKQIDHLQDPQDPEKVAQFLSMRRDVMFLEFEAAIRHCMRDTFLHTGNQPAHSAITECMHFALHELSNAQKPALSSAYLNVPEPLTPSDLRAAELYPFRSFQCSQGPYPVHFWQWQQIEYSMQLCLAGLKEVDRHVAHGEILGVSLLMEDVLLSGEQDKSIVARGEDNIEDGSQREGGSSISGDSHREKSDSVTTVDSVNFRRKKKQVTPERKSLSLIQQPLESYQVLKVFLLLWKRLEMLKEDWGKKRLGTESIGTVVLYRNYRKEYQKEVLYPVYQSVARKYGQAELYEGLVTDNQPIAIPRGATEMEIKTKQLLKLMENLECHMISEVRKKLGKELNLVLAERAREEGALPTDLWKKPQMKESFTISKPQIAEEFIEELMKDCVENGKSLTIPKAHLNHCLSMLATNVMTREKSNYESYTMYYENLLRVHHQLLYQREQEIKQVKSQLASAKNNTVAEVQCELAEQSHDLLMEITALRAKISEMREHMMTQERDIEERIREKYDRLVKNLFSSAFELKAKFDEFRNDLHDDVYEKISETRRETIETMTKLKQRLGAKSDDEFTNREKDHAKQVREVQEENHKLTTFMVKLKTLGNWKQTQKNINHTKQQANLKRDLDSSRRKNLELHMIAEEEIVLLRQQLLALKSSLKVTEREAEEVKKQLEKELREKKEKSHEAKQRAQSQKQLEDAKRANIEKLLEELEDKDSMLKYLSDAQDKTKKLQQIMTDKAKKDVTTIKKQLSHERSLKLDAFQRVDELQAQMYDFETTSLYSRPQTAIGVPTVSASAASVKKSRSRATSAGVGRSQQGSSLRGSISPNWPPPVTLPANRSLTPNPDPRSSEAKKIQRPKSTVTRLRSRIADQLVHELDPPNHHEILIRLQELHQQQQQEQQQARPRVY